MSESFADKDKGSAKGGELPPIILDLGKQSSKKVKQIKQGIGPYVDEVEPAVEQVKARYAKELQGKEVVPVVVLYERKRKRARLPIIDLLPR